MLLKVITNLNLKKTVIMTRIEEVKGEVAEWSKAHAWKVCVRQKRTVGSNPTLSAKCIKNTFSEA